jgi:DtxR family manganese transport transcriptional regulator
MTAPQRSEKQPRADRSRPSHRRTTAPEGYRRIRADHAREIAEDYVELIDDLIRESGEARVVDIASRLGVSHVTVSKTILRLIRDGLVVSEPYRAVFLTPQGRRLARAARRRHDLVLEFLLSLGVPRAAAEADAEGIEHHLSTTTLEAMRRCLRRNRGGSASSRSTLP